MKITSDQLAALQQEQKNTTQTKTGEGFAQILSQEMQSDSTTSSGALSGAVPIAGLGQTLQATMLLNSASTTTPTEQTVMEKMDSLLTQWENYSQAIGSSDGSLKEGYHLLADIRQNIQEVKGNLAQTSTEQGLSDMVEELDILATTEEFKFNRGDYLN